MLDQLTCPHGYEAGPRSCPMCRAAMPEGVLKADPSRTAPILRAIDPDPSGEMVAAEWAYSPRTATQFGLPYRDPGSVPVIERVNGSAKLSLSVPYTTNVSGVGAFRYPFGVIPRLVLLWMATEVKKQDTEDRRLVLGDSLGQFMRAVGIPYNATVARRVAEQVNRLSDCTIRVTDSWDVTADVRGKSKLLDTPLVSAYQFYWSKSDQPVNTSMFPSWLELSQEFYNAIKQASIPVDMGHLAALRSQGGGGLPIDIYCWLAHRMSYLKAPTRITWAQIVLQFGSQYTRQRDFNSEFVKALGKVLAVYPGFNVQQWEHGLILGRSKPPIAKRTQPR